MHLRRRLDTIGETHQIDQQDVKPNFFAAAPPPLPAAPNDKDIDKSLNGKAGGGAKATSTGVAVGLVAFLYILMMICKIRSRREFTSSGQQRSVHHRGNKRKVAPAPAQAPELPVQAQQRPNNTNNNDERNNNTLTNDAGVVDEEQPQMNQEEQQNDAQAIGAADDIAGSYAMAATVVESLP